MFFISAIFNICMSCNNNNQDFFNKEILHQIYNGLDRFQEPSLVECQLNFTDLNNKNNKIKIKNINWYQYVIKPEYALLIEESFKDFFDKSIKNLEKDFYELYKDITIKHVGFYNADGYWLSVNEHHALFYKEA